MFCPVEEKRVVVDEYAAMQRNKSWPGPTYETNDETYMRTTRSLEKIKQQSRKKDIRQTSEEPKKPPSHRD